MGLNNNTSSLEAILEMVQGLPEVTVKYTNVLKLAIESTGQSYNSGKGYKENMYLSDSNTEVTSSDYDITGFIPINPGDVVRLKNVQLCKQLTDGSTKCRIYYCDSDFSTIGNTVYLPMPSYLSSQATWEVITNDAGTDIIQFTLPNTYNTVRYIRITCGELTAASIITINEEID